ncbi:winged helix-turn-helix transcriptional regulator [Methanoculleus sp. Wushi-C6]|uniref:Winged helix-turn-helix transcriptional regulator n=1 Tax=Methanoculleus caldifontis TaxID=2651577 RepID=A0ABU3X2E9_9EURY|nr:AAA family ATPase [Methanoculleus sp. Wushi-C6]MDV2481940.1 winged helix-turn-helix transcriptional regulator [Methanoculleus sp. Wushi-C6]
MPAPGRCYRYFPAALERETLEHLLVGRQELLESLFYEADRASASRTPRFFLLVGSRGAGKSHLMSLLCRRIRDELSGLVIPVDLAEEEYSIFRASDFFLRVLAGMGVETSDVAALGEDSLVREAAVERIAAAAGERQVVVFVENIHEVFDQMERREVRALRSVFQRTDYLSVIASAPSLFPGVLDHEEPFYNFFRVFHLRELDCAESKDLMRRVAEVDGDTAFIENFGDYEPGIEALRHLIGGNPGLVIRLYEILSQCGAGRAAEAFFRLADEQTPYYREVFRRLPGQRRLILDTILTAETPLTPKDVAERARLNLATVNAQLRRLEAEGYVVSRPMKKRTTYEARDRLFSLWRAMRRPAGRDRVFVLIGFLEAWHGHPAAVDIPYRGASGVMEGVALPDRIAAGRREDVLAGLKEAGEEPDDPDRLARSVEITLDLAGEELLAGNRANGLSLIRLAYAHAGRLDPATARRMTAGFLKRLIGAGEVSAVGSAVREIVLSGGAGYEGFLKPVADAVAIVEAKDTRLYYTRLQPEERAVVAGIVREITGSEELGAGV